MVLKIFIPRADVASGLLYQPGMQLVLRRYFWTTYLVPISLGLLIASRTVGLLIESQLWVAPHLEETQTRSPDRKLEPPALDSARLARLIGLRPGSHASDTLGAPPPADENVLTRSSLGVKFLGTLSEIGPQWSLASLEVRGRAASYTVGDLVEGAEIIEIERDRVIIWNNSRREFIDRESDTRAGPPVVARREPVASQTLGAGIRTTSPTEFEVPLPELNKIISDINTVATQARSAPVVRDGQVQGFRLFGIQPDSIFQRLGIANGDVIRRINEYYLDSADKGLQLFLKLRDARRIDVEIERAGALARNTYYVR